MKRAPESRELLDDVLAESTLAEFRAAMLGEVLQLARRRRWQRHGSRVAAAAAVAGFVGLLVWRSAPQGVTAPQIASSCEIVGTKPLAAERVVRTRLFDPTRVVSSTATVSVVSTTPAAEGLQLIGDAELLALAAPRPAALMRVGPGAQELIFADDTEPDATR